MIRGSVVLTEYDSVPCARLCECTGAAQVVVVDRCDSTMDIAHRFAADGAPHGTVVVANEQAAGRGRSGKSWISSRGGGVWASVVVRWNGEAQPGVLSLRVGLALAEMLDAQASTPIQLKWPNDLYRHGRKVAGVLTEARWRGDALEWLVVGVGVNLLTPDTLPDAASLDRGPTRAAVLSDVVRAVIASAARTGDMSQDELDRFARRDVAVGREVISPLAGIVLGITSRGGLQVRTPTGVSIAFAGSLVFSNPHTE
jgi:BirA family transcriptional regulator, biotin operon repressor / biotin---[acetyl-CoA-carboxylase] ligase